jgi:hypothetical protein
MCGCGFKSKSFCDEHYKKCDGLITKLTKGLHNCTVCGEGLTSIKALKSHMNIHDPNYGNYECAQCNIFFESKGLLKYHR